MLIRGMKNVVFSFNVKLAYKGYIYLHCSSRRVHKQQWRIQDSPEEGAPTPKGGVNIRFCQKFLKLYEIKRIWTPGGGGGASLASPIRSATEHVR